MGNSAIKKTLADAATINIDRSLPYTIYRVTITANRALTLSNFNDADSFILIVQQGGTGGHSLSLYGTSLTLNTAAGAVTTIGVIRDGDVNRITYSGAAEQSAQDSTDADAAAYIAAAGLTDPTETGALNDLVVALKSNSLWTKITGFWVFWDSFNESKFNLVNPTDSDAAFRLVQQGSGTFSNGYTNQNLAYLNTKITPDEANASGYFTRVLGVLTDVAESNTDFGRLTVTGDTSNDLIQIKNGSNNLFSRCGTLSGGLTIANATAIGRYAIVTGSGTHAVYKNGSSISSGSQTTLVDSNKEFLIGAGGNNGTQYATKKYSFAGIMDELTSGEVSTLDGLLSTFNTALGR